MPSFWLARWYNHGSYYLKYRGIVDATQRHAGLLLTEQKEENDSRNLFALRSDMHSLLFDQAKWVVVPKGSQMVVHFIIVTRVPLFSFCMGDHRTSKVVRKAWSSQAIPLDRPDLRITSRRAQVESDQGSVGTGTVTKKRKAMDAAPLDVVDEAQELEEDLRLSPLFSLKSLTCEGTGTIQ
ncbi:hypothetical protein AX14_002116 [Amanita brunnescens Koide BX004]|nr:hypothetical protein AX14_002116 [Amanita brunnescens Koide BX004]